MNDNHIGGDTPVHMRKPKLVFSDRFPFLTKKKTLITIIVRKKRNIHKIITALKIGSGFFSQ